MDRTPPLTHRHQQLAARPLSRAQFSFLRGLFQGLDERQLWARYLPGLEADEPARIRQQAAGWIEQLASLARRHGRPELSACLRWPSRRAPRASGSTTIDDFASRFPADMHSEAEILALWRDAEQPADDRAAARRRARRVERQLEALRWLEGLDSTPPLPTDRVDGWLAPGLAARLTAAGIGNFAALRHCIEQLGNRWHRAVPRLGAAGAARIEAWLHEHALSLGAMPSSGGPHGVATADAASPLVPLERLHLPADLTGADGSNRGDRRHCRLSVAHDLEAVRAWLAEHLSSPHTARAYRREAERLLLWSVFERSRALSSLDASDCSAYLAFLRNPPPRWLAPRHRSRQSVGWRPVEAALSEPSIHTAAAIARALFAWLVRQRYLADNPWGELSIDEPGSRPPARAPGASNQAAFSARGKLAQSSGAARSPRLQALFELACATGLGGNDLAAARVAWLRIDRASGQAPRVSLCTPARGRWPARRIELPASAITALKAHGVIASDRPNALAPDDDRPLFGHRGDPRRPLSSARIGTLLAEAFVPGDASPQTV